MIKNSTIWNEQYVSWSHSVSKIKLIISINILFHKSFEMIQISHERYTNSTNSFWMQFEYVNTWCVLINRYYKRNVALEMKYKLYEIGMKYGQNKQKISGVSWVGFFWSRIRPWFYYILQLSLSCFVSNIHHSPHIHHSGTLTSRVKLKQMKYIEYLIYVLSQCPLAALYG